MAIPRKRGKQPIPIPPNASMSWTAPEYRSTHDQLERYLIRLRQSVPFPVPLEDCYFGCMPHTVKQLHTSGAFSSEPAPSRANNLLLTIYQAGGSPVVHHLHISAEDIDGYAKAMNGLRGYERLFWIEVDGMLPAPRNSIENPLYLPPDHPDYKEIIKWVDQATAVENEIEGSLKLIAELQLHAQTPSVVVKTWPELASFLSTTKGVPNNVSKSIRSRALNAVPMREREKITTQLARAVMLPEAPPNLQAWVGFRSRGRK